MMPEGGEKYQIKGCAGQGGFAQVFKAYVNSNPDDVVALKVIIFCDTSLDGIQFTEILLHRIWIFQSRTDSKAAVSLGILHVPSTWHADSRKRSMWILQQQYILTTVSHKALAHLKSMFFRGRVLALLTDCISILTTVYWSLIILLMGLFRLAYNSFIHFKIWKFSPLYLGRNKFCAGCHKF